MNRLAASAKRLSGASILFVAAAALTAFAHPALAQWGDRPNVVLLIGTNHSTKAVGAYGGEQAETPNLDRMAREGFAFTRAYVNAPAEVPSRFSLLTGKLPHTLGITLNRGIPEENEPTLADMFRYHGYGTGAGGEFHMPERRTRGNRDPIIGFRSWDGAENLLRFSMRLDPEILPADVEVAPLWRPAADPAREWLNADYLPVGATVNRMKGSFIASAANRFIENFDRRPFFWAAGYDETQAPFEFPLDMRGLYDPAEFEPIRPGAEDETRIPLVFRRLSDDQQRGIRAAYFTSVAFVDRAIGWMLDVLEENGASDNTLIVYASDTGAMLGEHGWFEKYCLYEPAVRVPLIFYWPGKIAPGRSDALIELIDVAPTMLELCGIEPPERLDGRSFAPVVLGNESGGRDFAFGEFLETESAMVRDRRYKLIYSTGARERRDGFHAAYAPDGPETRLYDLQADPGETTNLADRAQYAERIEAMKRRMLERFEAATPGGLGLPATATLDERLALHLVPRETWGWIWGLTQ